MEFRISYVQVLDYWAYYCHIAGIHMGVELSEFGSSEKEKNNIMEMKRVKVATHRRVGDIAEKC